MNATYRLIEILKIEQNLTSDYAVAKYVGVRPQKISSWKHDVSEANNVHLLKIIIGAKVTLSKALEIIEDRETCGCKLSLIQV